MLKRTPYEYFSDAVKIGDKPDLPGSTKVLYVTMLLLQVAARILVYLGRDATAEQKQQVKLDALRIYREKIAPWDLPGVPNVVEPWLDNGIEAAIAAGADMLLARIAESQREIDQLLSE